MKHLAKVEKGNVVFQNLEAWQVDKANNNGNDVVISLEKRRANRSSQQNRYYHGVVLKLLSEHTGYTTTELHEILKLEFNGKEKEIGGKSYLVAETTTNLTTTEWEGYMSVIRSWASATLGVFIPSPNEENIL